VRDPTTLGPGWHAALLRGFLAAQLGALAAASGLTVCSLLAIGMVREWESRPLSLLVPTALLLLAAALLLLLVGAIRLARPVAHIDRGGAFTAVYLGTALLVGTGLLEVVGSATLAGRVAHAAYALFAVTLLAAGIVAMPRSARALRELLALGSGLDAFARRLRMLALLVLAASLLLPFAPMLLRSVLPGVTPRACLVYSGAIGALLAAVPFVGLAALLGRTRTSARAALVRLDRCPHCGYRRPAQAVCPECGSTPALSQASV
jgi:hypothetical protein